MGEFKKNIILLPAFYDGVNNQKGILNVENDNGQLKCNVKCFNLKQTNEEFLFSVIVNDDIFKTKVLAKELSSLTYIVKSSCKAGDKISCLILSIKANSYDILLWGSTETTKVWQTTSVQRIETELKKEAQQVTKNYQNINNSNNTHFSALKQDVEFEKEQQAIEDYIDKIVDFTNNHDVYYQTNKDLNGKKNNINCNNDENNINDENNQVKRDKPDYQNEMFYERVKNQIEDIFNNSEQDELLKNIIPNGRFCKVKMEEGYYVFGVIYEDTTPRYICYGIPCQQKGEKPIELEGNCEWLPLDTLDENGKGYWLSYQDAFSGKNIKVEVIT